MREVEDGGFGMMAYCIAKRFRLKIKSAGPARQPHVRRRRSVIESGPDEMP